jgi:hypothetical protein
MIRFDEQQERCLYDIFRIILRARGRTYARRWRRRARWLLRCGMTIHRFIFPRSFNRWNEARIREYRGEA